MADLFYNEFLKHIGDGTHDWDNAGLTYRLALVGSGYTPNRDTHVFVSDLTNELSGGGYVRKDLVNRSIAVDDTNDWANWLADNITWASLTGALAAAVVFRFVTTDADSPLVRYVELTDVNPGGLGYTIQWDGQAATGTVVRLRQAA